MSFSSCLAGGQAGQLGRFLQSVGLVTPLVIPDGAALGPLPAPHPGRLVLHRHELTKMS